MTSEDDVADGEEDDGNLRRTRRGKRACEPVGDIADRLDRLHDPPPGIVGIGAMAAQDPRNCHLGLAGPVRDVIQRRHLRGAGAPAVP